MRRISSVLISALVTSALACGPGGKPGGGATAEPTGGGSATGEKAAPTDPSGAGPTSSAQIVTKTLQQVGLDPAALDTFADPCDDFFQYACGGWVKSTEIPADKPIAMRSFVEIDERNKEYLKGVLEQAAASPGDDPALKKVGTFYAACMNEAAIDKVGLEPIKPQLSAIGRIKDARGLTAAVAELHKVGVNALFTFTQTQDSKDATTVIGGLDQSGLGLPDRDYYLKDDPQSVQLRQMYQAYVEKMLTLGGSKPAAAKLAAADVLAVETAMAKVSKTQVERRDPYGTYNRIERAGLLKSAPHFGWDAYFKALGVADVQAITTTSVPYFEGIDPLIGSTKVPQWKSYLTFQLLNSTAPLLGKRFEEAQFGFVGMLTGQQQLPPRWKRCVGATDNALGELLGQIFVRDRFSADAKEAAQTYVHAIATAMEQNLGELSWMDAKTRERALDKLHKMASQIGYPDSWRTYDFPIGAAFTRNALAGRWFEKQYQLSKIGKPVNRGDWALSPPTVNAFYDPSLNRMVFPAGILQPPFYSVEAPIPVNLGAMGMVVGHELTHGFDDQGAQYDAQGNLTNWWEQEVGAKFKEKTTCVVEQYNQYEVLPGVKVNGSLTTGENIADVGGIKLAFRAYRALRNGADKVVVADGRNEDQQFFLGFAQSWCAKVRPELAALLANVDPHSPARWRVNGTLQDTPAFAEAFSCKLGSRMRPKSACEVW
jgi:putative endopeptidase